MHRIETDPLLPFCADCGAQHRPATNGKGEAVWCGGSPTWATRIIRAQTGRFSPEDKARAAHWNTCAFAETFGSQEYDGTRRSEFGALVDLKESHPSIYDAAHDLGCDFVGYVEWGDHTAAMVTLRKLRALRQTYVDSLKGTDSAEVKL